MRFWYLSHRRPASAQSLKSLHCSHTWSNGSDQKSDIYPHWRAAHARLKNEFTEDEKYHNRTRWLNDHVFFLFQFFFLYPETSYSTCVLRLWPMHTGFLLMYGSLIIKTWRWVLNIIQYMSLKVVAHVQRVHTHVRIPYYQNMEVGIKHHTVHIS